MGAGATGGYFGAQLQQAGHDVTFLVRPARAQQLAEQGLVIKGFHQTITLTPNIIVAEQLPDRPWPLIILAVKHPHLDTVIKQIRPAVGQQTFILPLLNGMTHLDRLQQQFGDRVLGGLCQLYATLNSQQHIEQLTPLHRLRFGALSPHQQAEVVSLAEQLQGVSFSLQASDDILSDMWEKYLFLSTLGAATCLARGDTQRILATRGGQAYLSELYAEVLSVMSAAGYQPRPQSVNTLRRTLLNPDTPLVSSLYRDVIMGSKASESEAIIGTLVGLADTHQLAVPVLRACWVQLQVNHR